MAELSPPGSPQSSPAPMDEESAVIPEPTSQSAEPLACGAANSAEAVLENIAQRQADGEFPAVLPSEVDAVSRQQAADALTWVKKDEAVRIQSFMHAKYKSYRETLPASDIRAERVIQAEWARLFYYCHLRAWCAQHGVSDTSVFVPAVPPEFLPDAKRQVAEALLVELRPANRFAFEALVKKEVACFLSVLPSTFTREMLDASVDAWHLDRYYDLLSAFIAEQQKAKFHPLLSLDQVASDRRPDFEEMCRQMIFGWGGFPSRSRGQVA